MNPGAREATSRGRLVTLAEGRKVEVRPLALRDFGQLEEQALEDHKRSYIQTFTKNIDLIPPEHRSGWVREAFLTAAGLTMESLPAKEQTVPLLDKFGDQLRDNAGQPQFTTASLPYALWWSSNTFAGMLNTVWLSIRKAQPDLKYEDLDGLLGTDVAKLEELANTIGDLSRPEPGNDGPPA